MILHDVDVMHIVIGVRGKMLSKDCRRGLKAVEKRRDCRRSEKSFLKVPSDMGDLNCNQFL